MILSRPSILTLCLLAVLPATAHAQDWCPSPQSVSGPQVSARMNSWQPQSKVNSQDAVYNPPPGCFILECRPRIVSAFGHTPYSVSGVAAASSFVTRQEFDESYKSAFDFAASLVAKFGDLALEVEIKTALEQLRQQHLKYLYAAQSSHQACTLHAEARGRGRTVDKGSSIVLTVDVRLCCGLDVLRDSGHLTQELRRRVEEIAAKRSRITPAWPGFTEDREEFRPDPEHLPHRSLEGIPIEPEPVSWTPWLNRDLPSGTGDFESTSAFIAAGQICKEPTAIECRRRDSGELVHTGVVGREKYLCEVAVGGVCDNRKQEPGVRCSDYEVRFGCK